MSRQKKPLSEPRLMKASNPDPYLEKTLAEEAFADLAYLYRHDKKSVPGTAHQKKSLPQPRLLKKHDPRLERLLAEEALFTDLTYLNGPDRKPRVKLNRRQKPRV